MVLAAAVGAYFFFVRNGKDKQPVFKKVAVTKGDVVEKALAIGKIDPDYEIVVKSQVSGIVDEIYKEVGESVRRGEPLMVVKPEPTPMELASTRRELELAELNRSQADRDLKRASQLKESNLLSEMDFENAQKNYQVTVLREKQARERLELMEKGRSKIGGKQVETVIRSPVDGTILERLVNRGDPVVPLTSYQPGTELMKMADMDSLIFIGTVDEIDVGKLEEGMLATIYIGALPGDTLHGELYFISPKSRTNNNAIVFDIKIKVTDPENAKLRAGYSANADIVIRAAKDVPSIPERLVTFRNDSTFVNLPGATPDTVMEHPVKIGLSDGLNVEVAQGLAIGDSVAEKAKTEIN